MREHRWLPQRRHGLFARWRVAPIRAALLIPAARQVDDRQAR